jgi:hypothetical protein
MKLTWFVPLAPAESISFPIVTPCRRFIFPMANVRLNGLESLEQRLKNPALFRAWGQYLERRMVTAFRTETSPAGQKWVDLQSKTRLSKRIRKRPKSRYQYGLSLLSVTYSRLRLLTVRSGLLASSGSLRKNPLR